MLRTRNNLGQYIPVAIPDTTTYPGVRLLRDRAGPVYPSSCIRPASDHLARLPADQHTDADPTVSQFHYLGPLIVAKRDAPVRIKFTNNLPTGAGGDLFIPVDTTVMGAGMGPCGYAPACPG